MLTFTQLELHHVSAVTMAGESSGEAKTGIGDQRFHWPLLCNRFFREKRKSKKRGSEKRVSKQRRYAVSKQRTMLSGLAVVYLLLSALTERERVGERARAARTEIRKEDHHSH